MKIEKHDKDAKRYPYVVTIKNGRRVWIPQQKQFGTYCSNHGCSVTAVSVALQTRGIIQGDKSIWNPKEIYNKAKDKIGGYNGSKLSIWGCKSIINKIAGSEVAFWHPSTCKNKSDVEHVITTALNRGWCVLFEEKNPIHTVALLGFDGNGKVVVATNGKVVRRSLKTQLNYRLCGTSKASNQKNWWNGKDHGAGYVVVKC